MERPRSEIANGDGGNEWERVRCEVWGVRFMVYGLWLAKVLSKTNYD